MLSSTPLPKSSKKFEDAKNVKSKELRNSHIFGYIECILFEAMI
jgi:ribosomal protein S17E